MALEPKVFAPHAFLQGQTPRKVLVERKRREFNSFNINEEMHSRNAYPQLHKMNHDSVFNLSLHLFDDDEFEYRPIKSWLRFLSLSSNGLKARAMYTNKVSTSPTETRVDISWEPCWVTYYDEKTLLFDVKFAEKTEKLHRLYICFDTEDPSNYCNRFMQAINLKSISRNVFALQVYVDCMPVDFLRPLDPEQVMRIIDKALNKELKGDASIDPSIIIEQYNLNHTRTINQLILTHKLKTCSKDIMMVNPLATDTSLFPSLLRNTPHHIIQNYSIEMYREISEAIRFNSLWNKIETIRIMLQIQNENLILEKCQMFNVPENKSVRVDDFSIAQNTAINSVGQLVKESWVSTATSIVMVNLKNIQKGWFNVGESSAEVYSFSKLKRFMQRLNFMMEDSLRIMITDSVKAYCATIKSFCPSVVKIESSSIVEVIAQKNPLFTVDLKYIEASASGSNEASFIYTTKRESFIDAILFPVQRAFDAIKGVAKVERRVMKHLFWPSDPLIRAPYLDEEWAKEEHNSLEQAVIKALQPMQDYLGTLHSFKELISIDIKVYEKEAEMKFCSGDSMNLPDLCALAHKHALEADEIAHMLPTTIGLGLVLVDCRTVKSMLSTKHKSIATSLFKVLEHKIREFSESIITEFRDMYNRLVIVPSSIESIVELREFIVQLPARVTLLSDRIQKNESHFMLIESAKWQIPFEQMDMRWEVLKWTGSITTEISKQEKNLKGLELTLKKAMEDEQLEFSQDVQNLEIEVMKLKELTYIEDAKANADIVRKLNDAITFAEDRAKVFNSREGLFNTSLTEYSELKELSKKFEPYFELWDSAEMWMSSNEKWINGSFMHLDAESLESLVTNLSKNLSKSAKTFEKMNLNTCRDIAGTLRQEVDLFKPYVPLVLSLRNPGMRDRHWDDLSSKIGANIPSNKEELTLKSLINMGFVENMHEVDKVAEKAGKEYAIETSLEKMERAWDSVRLQIEEYKETGTFILKGADEYMALLDEHITVTQAMAFSPFKGPFEKKIESWNSTLQMVSEVIDEWVSLQRNWLYLQPIFGSADINKQLPQEGKRFASVDKYWRTTMQNAKKGVMAIKFCDDIRLVEKFKEGNKLLDTVQKGLADYLETKRAGFSRFYFLSNDELLEILSETKDPLRVQPHLRKCFEGIKAVEFEEDMTISGMVSPEGERVIFRKPVDPKSKNIEMWMVEVKDMMVASVRLNMLRSIVDYTARPRTEWMQKWAAQCVLNGSQCHWTREVEEAFKSGGNKGALEYYQRLVTQLNDMVLLIRGNISKAARVTVGSLAVIDVHARDVQRKMVEDGVSAVTDFAWISQMRYYWEGDIDAENGNLAVIMVSSKRWYGYEYLGNTFRLVITPLTDKCYLTLMGALQMILGGAPAGPAGTGKTETTKDLAKALAMQCVVFNCSDGLDYQAMGKFFKGLASSGAWACFDEFNRINIEVLSVIAQQVIQLQSTVQRGEARTVFEGTDIPVNPDFSVFITMNPGYAGRAELPDNLEALFRPVAMMVPDYGLIAEIMLFSFGYMDNRKCSQKMAATFRLCSEQLSAQDHYDYGMRAVKTVITAAGNLKRASPEANEEALLMRALQDVNTPKFLAHDLPLFAGILSDLFPGVERPPFDYGPLIAALKVSIHERNLQPIPIFLRKNIELYEMICVRHGLMVVGPTGGGKSENVRVLCAALTRLNAEGIKGERFEKTKIYHLNPKSIKMGQLYGEFDENTHEWRDGILCVLIRKCIKEDNANLKWMLFDGPVDAIWIENMNTVLDDNKKLCLTSGEIIQLSNPMTMMFEPEDLAVASPATVSRCGMIYMEPNSLGYDVLLMSWLNNFPSSIGYRGRAIMTRLFDFFVPSVLPHMRRNLVEPLPTTNNCLVEALLNLLDTFLKSFHDSEDGSTEKKTTEQIEKMIIDLEPIFVFCLIWSMCGTVNAKGRQALNMFIRSEMVSGGIKNLFPLEGSIYDYKYDIESSNWLEWTKTVQPYQYDPKLTFSELIIPTKDSICYTYLLDILVRSKKHLLMTGPTGTGKTVNILGHLQNGLPDKYVSISIAFSAQTTANQTQDLIDSKCEKRRKGVYGPSSGKEFIIFVDDVNMPMKEEYGAQPPIEILRQWFDNGGWYDRKALELRKVIDVIFVCACGPPGGGRNHVTARFYRHFNTVNYVDMSDESLSLIFTTILGNFLTPFENDLVSFSSGIVKSTIDVYNRIIDELRPTPTKPHYTFNMRDISKVFQGMLMCDKRKVSSTSDLGRLWVHEVTRVFGDRLINETDRTWFKSCIETTLFISASISSADLWSNSSSVIYTDFMIPSADTRVYEEVENPIILQSVIEDYLQDYNSESKQPMNLVMFNDAVLHVVKISRVLRQPSGHALLLGVGGSGRQSLTKLASFISSYKIYQISIAKGYGMHEWRENLRECLMYAGVKNKPIVFLYSDTQIINESMLEDINGALNSGDVPNLYGIEDLEEIATACKSDCVKRRVAPTKLNIFAQYLLRIRANLHVVLCMSPLGDAFRTRLLKFPSIVNCCTIDWFMEWPDEALKSVAAQYLVQAELNIERSAEATVISMFQYIHQSIEHASTDFYNTMRRRYYVTPTSYLELLSTYEKVLKFKRLEVGRFRDRLSVGVDKLVSTEIAVNELKATLTEMEPQLIQTQADVEVMIVQITKDKALAAETKASVEIEEASASEQAAATKAIADSAQKDLDEAIPALAEAVQCLKDLKKADIDEVKSFSKPSANVVRTLMAVCIMFDVKPLKENDPDNPGKKRDDYFKAAKNSLLGDAKKLLDDMTNFDKDNISHHIIAQIEPFSRDETFTPDVIAKSSTACKAMCMWVLAMYKYHQVTLIVEPKKLQLAEAQVSLDATMKVLAAAQETLQQAEEKITALEASFNEANDKKEQLVFDVDQCRARLDRAVKLMSGLGGEKVRWTENVRELSSSYNNLIGDCLIAAGAISYLGAFTPDYRQNIVAAWQHQLEKLGVLHSPLCNLRTTLADPIAIRQWTICGLPQDSHSVENAIIMSKGRRYPLLIDPQGQANRYIKKMGKDASINANDIDVIKLSEKNFLRTLEIGVRHGKWILLENILETLDAALEPLLLQQKFKQGGTEMIKIGDSFIPWNDSFRFFMTTKLSNPHYPPEVCVKVSLVNFAITFTGLEDQLLGVVVVEEMPEMEEKKNTLVLSNARMRKELQELEDQILNMLSTSTGNILDDHKLIETLATSKVKSSEISVKVAEAEVTEKQIDESRNEYRPVAYRGSILYFCIADLASVDPMYQYSLEWFRNLFIQAIRSADKYEDITLRIVSLNDFFTYYVYVNICRSLFEKHKLLFSFLLTVRILQGKQAIDADEWTFLVSGKTLSSVKIDNPSPDWIDNRMWSELCHLSSLGSFNGIAEDVSSNVEKWRAVYDSLDPHLTALPGYWNSKNSFEKLCILRAIRADKVPESVLLYVIEMMGQRFTEPPPFDLNNCFKDSSVTTPLIFVLSKGSDPTKMFSEFANKMKMDKKTRMLSLGQGQGGKAAHMVDEAITKGLWVFLQNCHLFISWLPELERITENYPESIHKDFRLWLTSMPCDDFPVSVLQSAVKMTNEPPKGLKANLRNAYYKLNNDLLGITKKPTEYKKLLFGLSFFHAVVQERRLFGPLGFNIPYEFNDTDLDISKGQLELFIDQYDEIPWKVLNFLTSYINYGGRVTDYIDLRTMDVIMKSFYNPKLLRDDYKFDKEGVFYSFAFDPSDPHKSYMQYIETLPQIASPAVFGMHENAKIASANAETFSMFELLLSLQAAGAGGGGGSGSREKLIEVAAKDIFDKNFKLFDIENVSLVYPVIYEESMNTVLLQECIRYNKLIAMLLKTLPDLLNALKGLVAMSNELDAIASSIALNQVPKSWASVAYPSMKPCSSWVEDLVQRIQFITDWIERKQPSVFWISGFYFPQAFLTGSMQNFARKCQYPIDTIAFDFNLISEAWNEINIQPSDGVYIRGLYLEGARWDANVRSLNDSLPKQLYTELPVIHLLPVQHRVDPEEGIYRCPVYKILSRRGTLSTTGHSTNFIMWIEIPSNRTNITNHEGKADQEEWIRAGVAAFSSLMY